MAKVNHNNFLDTIKSMGEDGIKNKVLYLESEDTHFDGQNLLVESQYLKNFGTCGYLGLETDERLIKKSIDYTRRFGTQFSVSRGYLTFSIHNELEKLLSEIYGGLPVLVYSSTSLAHTSVIPSLIRDNQAIILDQQVHMSVQLGAQLVKAKGLFIDMIKHSNMDMLDAKLAEMSNKYDKIWYMVDGVYSMFGDVAPFDGMASLMKKYPKLHCYIDCAHGMSWYGKNGAGYTFEKFGVNDRVILMTTLAKGYGSLGGAVVLPNQEVYFDVRNFGGPLSYSHPLAPSVTGAAIASAEIHLSPEINQLQGELKSNIDYANLLLDDSDLLVVSNPETPIYFIGMGQPKVGYQMVRSLIEDGFYVNPSMFPTVPIKNTGLRFTLTRHQSKEDIKALIEAVKYHFPRILEKNETDIQSVYKAFRRNLEEKQNLTSHSIKLDTQILSQNAISSINGFKDFGSFTIKHFTDIAEIDPTEWDAMFAKRGSFDYSALKYTQEIFKDNPKLEDNADFHYLTAYQNNKPVIASFFSFGLYKDDLLANYSVSEAIEERRKTDPYYLCSNTFAMGSILTEGYHCYIDKEVNNWQEILTAYLKEIASLADSLGAQNIMLRDFAPDKDLDSYFFQEGFAKVDMPFSNVAKEIIWKDFDGLLNNASRNSKMNLKRELLPFIDRYTVEYKNNLTEEETEWYYKLYLEVKKRNLGVNYFDYPFKLFKMMSEIPNWEFVIIHLKPEFHTEQPIKPVAVAACYKGIGHYTPTILGMDYRYAYENKVYKQVLYRVMERGRQIGYETFYMGITADIDKRKFGAEQYPRVAYIQAKDNFNFEVMEAISTKVNV
jgi:7-keto-8-aminopelargonate synthetase-like enzyme